MPTFSKRSLQRLFTCDQQLQDLFLEVIKERDCTIVCGYRGPEDQEQAFREGKSKAHFGQSAHNFFPSKAVDVVPYPVNWSDKEGITEFAMYVLEKAKQMGINIKWGGAFKSFFDGPHYELDEKGKV